MTQMVFNGYEQIKTQTQVLALEAVPAELVDVDAALKLK
jgi:hypothetical protein